jgi:hypothetical protein
VTTPVKAKASPTAEEEEERERHSIPGRQVEVGGSICSANSPATGIADNNGIAAGSDRTTSSSSKQQEQ